jgi:hypothetical protein
MKSHAGPRSSACGIVFCSAILTSWSCNKFILILDVINIGYTIYFTICCFKCETYPATHKGMHSDLALKLV